MSSSPRNSVQTLWGVVMVVLAACGHTDEPHATIRDSAGVRITHNPEDLAPTAAITVAATPLVSIGGSQDDTALQFHGIVGVTRLSDHTIVVADASSRTLRYFAENGSLTAIVGRLGDGPGEFRQISRVWRGAADSIFVYDHFLGRLSVYDANARYLHSTRLGTRGRRPILLGALPSGRLLGYYRMALDHTTQRSGIVRDSVFLVAFTRDGQIVGDSIGPLPATEFVIIKKANGISVAPRAFSRSLHSAIGAEHIAVGSQDSFQIDLYTPDGYLVRSVRRASRLAPITKADIARYQAEWRVDIRSDQQATVANELLRVMTYPSSWPAHGAIEFDTHGNLWVRNTTTNRDSMPGWNVFNADGVWLTSVAVPPRLGVFEIGGDYILGRWRDADGIEFVRVHALRRE